MVELIRESANRLRCGDVVGSDGAVGAEGRWARGPGPVAAHGCHCKVLLKRDRGHNCSVQLLSPGCSWRPNQMSICKFSKSG